MTGSEWRAQPLECPFAVTEHAGKPLTTATSYDSVAEEYTKRLSGELENKPMDRELLDDFADLLRSRGRVCDLGCGPGHVARYLHDRGARVFGMDISAGMCQQASALNPHLEFRRGDILATGLESDSLAGVVAFYSIIHVPPHLVRAALDEIRRILRPGGLLLLSHHVGKKVVHLDEWWGQRVNLDFAFFDPEEMVGHLRSGGFKIRRQLERPPYSESVEHQSHRAYCLAEKAIHDRFCVGMV